MPETYKQVEQERNSLRIVVSSLRDEVERWFKYVDPFDIFPEDQDAYQHRRAQLDADQEEADWTGVKS